MYAALSRTTLTLLWLLGSSFALASALDPLDGGDAISELGVARMAEEAGDATLRALLTAATDRQRTLLAVRASPHAYAPEQLVPPLARIACGRDPELAPEAAAALARMVERMRPDELTRREVLVSELAQARDALRCGAQTRGLRGDIPPRLALLADALLSR